MPNTPRLQLPYPSPSQNNNVPADLEALAVALDSSVVHAFGTAADRPVAGLRGRIYHATDTGVLSYDTGTTWLNFQQSVVRGSALPTTGLFDGLLYDLILPVTRTEPNMPVELTWRFRYRAAATPYPWEFVGGPPLRAFRTGDMTTNINNLHEVSGQLVRITLPYHGEYMVGHSVRMGYVTGGPGVASCQADIWWGAENIESPSRMLLTMWQSQAGIVTTHSTVQPLTLTDTFKATLNQRYQAAPSTNSQFGNRVMHATPVRVGGSIT